ncbi:MAG: hypothetical protein UR27_C0015G0045 [Candidatus Peregrinibacteria bacterium GW2011_GWA2_33_10]|nr:MAG: hypothetical protein UR27_C0015G0045 [Candidatus Peregrinibacteria bacterium GW2011_GWA2_33_10]
MEQYSNDTLDYAEKSPVEARRRLLELHEQGYQLCANFRELFKYWEKDGYRLRFENMEKFKNISGKLLNISSEMKFLHAASDSGQSDIIINNATFQNFDDVISKCNDVLGSPIYRNSCTSNVLRNLPHSESHRKVIDLVGGELNNNQKTLCEDLSSSENKDFPNIFVYAHELQKELDVKSILDQSIFLSDEQMALITEKKKLIQSLIEESNDKKSQLFRQQKEEKPQAGKVVPLYKRAIKRITGIFSTENEAA